MLDLSEAIQDIAAELQQSVSEHADLAREMEPMERHEGPKGALRLTNF